MYPLIRKALFKMEPERAHALTLAALRGVGAVELARWILRKNFATASRPVSAFGLTFKNPIGLAAGYDKDAVAIRGLAALGFGHIEIGTVTPLPQPGNPRPRVCRLVEDQAVVNRMGFPSKGSAYVQKQLSPRLRGQWTAAKQQGFRLSVASQGENRKAVAIPSAGSLHLTGIQDTV